MLGCPPFCGSPQPHSLYYNNDTHHDNGNELEGVSLRSEKFRNQITRYKTHMTTILSHDKN